MSTCNDFLIRCERRHILMHFPDQLEPQSAISRGGMFAFNKDGEKTTREEDLRALSLRRTMLKEKSFSCHEWFHSQTTSQANRSPTFSVMLVSWVDCLVNNGVYFILLASSKVSIFHFIVHCTRIETKCSTSLRRNAFSVIRAIAGAVKSNENGKAEISGYLFTSIQF